MRSTSSPASRSAGWRRSRCFRRRASGCFPAVSVTIGRPGAGRRPVHAHRPDRQARHRPGLPRPLHAGVSSASPICPDVCPTALQVMAAALDKLGPKAERITPVFITVDPERDTPAQLATYVTSFHPRLVGLTGTPDEIDGRRQGLSRLRQEGGRSQVDRRLHHGSFARSSTLWDRTARTARTSRTRRPSMRMAERLAKAYKRGFEHGAAVPTE